MKDFDPTNPTAALHRSIFGKAAMPPEAEKAPANVIDFRSSDQTLDRYQEIIQVAGWKLENYRRNPVVQDAHNYYSLADTIGRSLVTEVRGESLFQRIQFAVDVNPMAKLAFGLYQGGFLNAVSVGFTPIRWENGSAEAGYRRKYVEQELLEVSAVSIPANPNALALGLKSGAIERGTIKDAADQLAERCAALQKFCNQEAVPDTKAGDSGFRGHESHWLQIEQSLKTIRALLKR